MMRKRLVFIAYTDRDDFNIAIGTCASDRTGCCIAWLQRGHLAFREDMIGVADTAAWFEVGFMSQYTILYITPIPQMQL